MPRFDDDRSSMRYLIIRDIWLEESDETKWYENYFKAHRVTSTCRYQDGGLYEAKIYGSQCPVDYGNEYRRARNFDLSNYVKNFNEGDEGYMNYFGASNIFSKGIFIKILIQPAKFLLW